MTETTQAAAPAASQPVTIAQAATMLAEKRNAAQAKAGDISAHASAMGKRSAEARRERTTQVEVQPEAEEPAGESVTDDSTGQAPSETLNEDTANAEPSITEAHETVAEPEADQPSTIDLGDGVKVTLDEVRDSFMLKADHTRKTQALAEERKQLEGKVTQRLSDLDRVIASLEPLAGGRKPLTMRDFIQEHGAEEGLILFHEHQAKVDAARKLADRARATAQREARAKAEQDCDQYLVANHNKEWADSSKYESAQVEITKYAKSLGFSSEQIYQLGVIPGAIIALDKARQFDSLKNNLGEVKRTIADKPKVVKPGSKVSAASQAQTAVQNARAKASKSGSLADALAYWRAQRTAKGS